MLKIASSLIFAILLLKPAIAEVSVSLVIDAQTGAVLQQKDAGASWYPASLTKMMTAYVTLKALEEKRFSLRHGLRVSALAAKQAPAKMGFKVGSVLTVDTALKIIMVKSANDVSMTIAEGVSGSLPAFVKEMNMHAQNLGMSGTVFTNANGLPSPLQRTTARDMAILARALLIDFPEHRDLWDIPALEYNGKIIRNTNHLIGRYSGVMGMKTGFICASGFNIVAVASKNGRVLITVIMGAHTARERAEAAATLFNVNFGERSSRITLEQIQNLGGRAADIRGSVCKRRGKGQPPAAESAEYYDNEPVYGEAQSSIDFFRQEQARKEQAINRPLSVYSPTRAPEVIGLANPASLPAPILGVMAAVKPAKVKAEKPIMLQAAKPENKKPDTKKTTQKTDAKKPEVKKIDSKKKMQQALELRKGKE